MRVLEDPHYLEMKPTGIVALFRFYERPLPEPGQIVDIRVFGGSVKVYLTNAEETDGSIDGVPGLGIGGPIVKV